MNYALAVSSNNGIASIIVPTYGFARWWAFNSDWIIIASLFVAWVSYVILAAYKNPQWGRFAWCNGSGCTGCKPTTKGGE